MNYKMFAPTPRELYSKLKSSAKKRGIEFELTVYDLHMIDFPITCPACINRYRSRCKSIYLF